MMKKILFLSTLLIFACSSDDSSDNNPLPAYSIEGKWIWSPSESREHANTMYELIDGNVFTYYCITCPGDDAYWNSLDSTDRIPGVGSYSFDGDTLIWFETAREVTFECDGSKLFMDGEFSHLWRLSSNCQ